MLWTLFVRAGGHRLFSLAIEIATVFNYPAVETAATQTKPADAG